MRFQAGTAPANFQRIKQNLFSREPNYQNSKSNVKFTYEVRDLLKQERDIPHSSSSKPNTPFYKRQIAETKTMMKNLTKTINSKRLIF